MAEHNQQARGELRQGMPAGLCAAFLWCLFGAIAAHAQLNDWYDPCRRIEPGITFLGDMPERPLRVDAHVRVKQPAPGGLATAALAWNAVDSLNYSYARLTLSGYDDDIYLGKARISIGRVDAGIDYPKCEYSFESYGAYESVRLIYDGFSARVLATGNSYEANYDPDGPTGVMLIAGQPLQCQRLAAMGRASSPIEQSEYQDIDSLRAALRPSADKAEGLWEYMDRDITPGAATLGGQYVLATIKNRDGGYDIIYISGAEENSAHWTPLRLKGRLTPTIFAGNFDMAWTDANGHRLERECNAQLDPNGAILTLRFPLQRAQIRLRRIPFN